MQKRVVEPQADETRSETEKVAVETRLTAEQFYYEWAEGPSIRGIKRSGNLDALTLDFAEAFRDKSESELREELAETETQAMNNISWLREEIKRLKARLAAEQTRWGTVEFDKLQSELTELRAKLAEQERMGKIDPEQAFKD